MNARQRAQSQVLMAALLFSTGGLFMGLLTLNVWAIIFWRSLFALFFASTIAGICDRRALATLDRAGLVAALCSAWAMLAFIPALRLTSATNVAGIHGALPLITSLMMWWAGKGRAPVGNLVPAAGAGVGAAIIFSGSLASDSRLAGDGLALLMTSLMALMTVAFHKSQTSSYLLVALSNALAGLAGAVLAPSLHISLVQGCVLACFALLQMTFGLNCLATGSRALSPSETALLLLAEVPLSGLWVFLAFAQTPRLETIVGAGIIFCAVLAHLLLQPGDHPSERRADAD